MANAARKLPEAKHRCLAMSQAAVLRALPELEEALLGFADPKQMIYAVAACLAAAASVSYHVSPDGSDTHDGSALRPFRSLQHCHDVAGPGTVCEVASGVYRESVAIRHDGATFRGRDGAGTVLSGLDRLDGLKWTATSQNCVWRAQVSSSIPPITQLFFAGTMMVEARWPNLGSIANIGDAVMSPDAWRKVGAGSAYGQIADPALRVNFSWAGALATLNVAHQWYTWTRVVTSHNAANGTFDYPMDLPGLAGYDPTLYPDTAKIWDGCNRAKCNQYFLSGKREALDAPGEWFHDVADSALYFYPPSSQLVEVQQPQKCAAPAGVLEYKARDYAFTADGKANVTLENLAFKGATLQLSGCTNCSLSNLTLHFPTFDRQVKELDKAKGAVASTTISGTGIRAANITLTQSNNNGLVLSGDDITLDNCLISYVDWLGSLTYSPLGADGNQLSVQRCTVHDFGNAGVVTHLPNTPPAQAGKPQQPPQPMAGRWLEVAHTHIFHGARVGEDTAALYSGGWAAAGQVWHHNWVHDTTEKCLRFDDQSENATIHHNVVYNCGEPASDPSSEFNSGLGLVAKGDGHVIYANTIFQTNYSEMCLSNCIEKLKPYRQQYPRVMQNAHSQIFNTAANSSVGRCECGVGTPPGGNLTGIYTGGETAAQLDLVDVAAHDYRPKASSPLVDAGVVFPPYTDGYVGKAPDIGAYELGGERWVAGCSGMEGC